MRLSEILDGIRTGAEETPAVMAAIREAVAELRRNGTGLHALTVGEPFPDFMLPCPTGRLVERDELLATGPLVVTFFRGHWCPICVAALDAMLECLPAMRERGAGLVAVSPETSGNALRPGFKAPPGFRFLSDVDNGLALSCGIAFKTPPAYRALLSREGCDLAERQGSSAWFLPVPATFLVDREGIVRWSFVDVDFTRRAEPAEVLAALRALPG
ncbi:AhpC/TSA family protein [Roseomonas sp. SSH11]|uniref:AhpC/TSA family protein n=1 Tax=Pararoseomonas baculiformis TaxID=2820812 RepID=A0ABS4AHS4_9PROT|nr:peroxiredoxin-like family protein [Pararoseomonas baculiformis]MBP0446579.1 AhpC/TSA family protein [Pararoseomonas baculiformis]